ncbi:hypothetical protein [Mycobacteroides abscessus]|uniref:hypothetical protein n=1 Tax=Mycobacteroides abscessus TaxID=36809 RepID=UPI00157CC887|nr:hypothetical protein [Mycobacteroides abscessus]
MRVTASSPAADHGEAHPRVSGRPAAISRAALTSALHGPAVQATHPASLRRVRDRDLLNPIQRLCCSRTSNRPQPLQLIDRFNPRF